jgi:hypothetical protein
MLLKYFYDKSLAHASYLVGCQKTGEAIVIDPGRDIRQYLDVAAAEGMKIVGAADTHIHADYVSGARQLAHQIGAKLYLSDEGPTEWKYGFASQYAVEPISRWEFLPATLCLSARSGVQTFSNKPLGLQGQLIQAPATCTIPLLGSTSFQTSFKSGRRMEPAVLAARA